MAILTINDNPSISDTIVFTLLTPDAQGCFINNPYVVNNVTIYYVERDFSSGNLSEYDDEIYDPTKLQAASTAEANACANPTPANIALAKQLRTQADNTAAVSPFYFNEATPVQIVGNDYYPAWLSTDVANAFLTLLTEDSNNNPIYGQYTYTWQPLGMREGDYFICWTWTPLIAGSSLSSHTKFYLKGNTQITTSIPTHATNPRKYKTLLDRYTPEMFKMLVSSNDVTPTVLDNLNGAIALGFNTLEDLGNAIVDLQDANSISEGLLPYLSNFFGLKLKTDDPTRWRGQIKRAIPLYKMKGTKKALVEALEHAAIKMLGLNQLWEIISSYTWQEAFTYEGSDSFELEKVALPLDYENFGLWLRAENSNIWIPLSSDYVEFITSDGVTTVVWVGGTLSVEPLDLIDGDEILILYKYADVPDSTAQTIENYIRSLPLMDTRDERNQIYPLKNWNVRVIAQNDPMFNLVIPTRHPYHDFVVYGKVRTEFPYSENIYNMEEYNASIRNSLLPCDIDRNFVDPCTACISSSYNIDLEIEDLCDDRILEAKEVLTENTPFHAVLHTFNFLGGVNEFVESPIENIEALVSINGTEFVIAGEAQTYFNRVMRLVETNGILRTELAHKTILLSAAPGVAYNDNIVVFCPVKKFDDLGISTTNGATLHILAPSPLSGNYTVTNPCGNVAELSVVPGSEPIANCNTIWANETINTCAFAFDLNSTVSYISGTLCNIAQDNSFTFYDASQNFGLLGVKSTFDVNQGTANNAWQVSIPAYSATPYTISNVNPDGSLSLVDNGTLPGNTTGISYTILNGMSNMAVGSSGVLTTANRGLVTVLSSGVLPVQAILVKGNFFLVYDGFEYPISGFPPSTTDQFYIANYIGGDNNGVTLQINNKLLASEVGYLSYRGMKLQLTGNLEVGLGIQNGANSLVVPVSDNNPPPGGDKGIQNNDFKENFIVVIGSNSYFIADINGGSPAGHTTFTLSGPQQYWKTLNGGGTSVNVTIYQYAAEGATIMGQQFDLPPHTFRTLDRSGRPIIDETDEDGIVTGLSLPEDGNEINDVVKQNESISFHIQYADGTTEQGVV